MKEFNEYLNHNSGGVFCLVEKDYKVYKELGNVSFRKNLITYIECNSKMRHMGNGTLLLNRLESHLKKNGYKYIFLTSIGDSEEFYIKNGYRRMNIFDHIWHMNMNNMIKYIQ